ncbi:MAG: Smr/MutS family protein [Deltaproteobacteria bacterium]|nr:Smr/MutS family protein [Deltaproteobacteria bacterium]
MINYQTMEDLDWSGVTGLWKKHCISEVGVKFISKLKFPESPDESGFRRDLISEIVRARAEGISFSPSGLEDITEILQRLERGGVINTENLLLLLRQIETAHFIKESSIKSRGIKIKEFISDLQDMDYLYNLLNDSIERDGTFKSNASPELYGLKSRKKVLYREVTGKIEKIASRKDVAPWLQDDFFTHRKERTVLPVKSEFRSKISGTIRGVSNTGQTVFMEPAEIHELNSRLSEIDSEIELEELRLCSMLADSAADELDSFRRNQEILTGMDIWRSAALLAIEYDYMPWQWSPEGFLYLKDAKHPLLLSSKGEVIPNTIELEKGKMLIITGPNAGGKTVTIKTAGILSMMAAMGLHIPASSDSKIPVFGRIHTVIGDKQNISSHRSTFSAHIERLKDIIDNFNDGDLVIIDEIASGTSPSHGSVLAQAVMEHIVSGNATSLVTTHYSALKALAYTDPRFVNASVGGEALTPDFKLVQGMPGTSDGITLAMKMGLSGKIVRRARELAGEGDMQFDNLLTQLRLKNEELGKKIILLDEERKLLESEKLQLEKLESEKKKEIDRIRREGFSGILDEAARLKRVLVKLTEKSKDADESTRKEIRLGLERVEKTANTHLDKWWGDSLGENELHENMTVYSRQLGHTVKIISLMGKGKVLVDFSGMKTQIGVTGLYRVEKKSSVSSEQMKKPKIVVQAEKKNIEDEIAVITPSNTLDVRGRRFDEALNSMISFFDDMILKNETCCAIIHGFGSGVLRKGLREECERSPYVRHFRSGDKTEGGDGVTIAFIQ